MIDLVGFGIQRVSQRLDAVVDGGTELGLQRLHVPIDGFQRHPQAELANGRPLGGNIGGDNHDVGITAGRIQHPVGSATPLALLHQRPDPVIGTIHVAGHPLTVLVVVDREQDRLAGIGQLDQIGQARNVPIPDQRRGNGRQHIRQPLSFRQNRLPDVAGDALLLFGLLTGEFDGQLVGGLITHDLQAIAHVLTGFSKRRTHFFTAGL